MGGQQGYSKITTNGLVFAYDTGDQRNSYAGEPTTNIWGIQNGSSVNGMSGWSMPYAYNGSITNSVYTSGTWNGNRIWDVLHTLGTSGYGGYESWRLCVDQPTASPNTYSGTRRVAIKICVLEGSITDMALHTGGGNGSYNSSAWTPIPSSQIPSDCPQKTGWYQFYDDGSWFSTTVGHCVGLGFITYNRVRILTTEPMYYPSNHLIPFTPYVRSSTQGLLDISGTGTSINLANVSFNANAQYYFDGTDDYINFGNVSAGMAGASQATMELVINMTFPSAYQQIFGFRDDNQFDFFFLAFSGGSSEFRVRNSAGTYYDLNPNLSSYAGKPTHIVFCVGPEGRKVYANGVLIASNATVFFSHF